MSFADWVSFLVRVGLLLAVAGWVIVEVASR